jgi:hypothetical protein
MAVPALVMAVLQLAATLAAGRLELGVPAEMQALAPK